MEKFESNMATRFSQDRVSQIINAVSDEDRLQAMPVSKFMELLIPA